MSKWRRCTDSLPCLICGRKQHCSISDDGALIMAITDLDRELEWFETMPVAGGARTVRTACKIGDHIRNVDIIRRPEGRRVVVNLHLANLAVQFWRTVAGRIINDMEEHGKFCFINGSDE